MSKKISKFYNVLSIFYPVIDIFLRSQKKKLFREVNELPYGKLLEVGVGQGTHLKHYKTHKIVGIDTSLKMLEIAKKQNIKGIELIEMNGENILFENQTFDYVVLSHIITVVDSPNKLLDEAFRILKPNGTLFILNHFTPSNWLKYIDRAFHFFSKYFHFKSVFYIDELISIKKFRLSKEINLNKLSYFKILIYRKP